MLDIDALRAEFPVLAREVHGKPLIYFDNANTAQKPLAVIEAVDDYHRRYTANVARAVHALGEEATSRYEAARGALASWLGTADRHQIVLTRGTTESLNLVAWGWLRQRLQPGDVVLATEMEHHANIVPWQLIAAECGAEVRPVPVLDDGSLDLEALERLLAGPVQLLAVTHVSNVLGTINPIVEITALARRFGVATVVDGSQAAPHLRLELDTLGADFYAITGHKLFGPTGTGALWATRERLQELRPLMGGGEMIRTVSFAGTTFADPPHRFEAGTPNIAGHIGLAAAIRWLQAQDFDLLGTREQDLGRALEAELERIPGLRRIGTCTPRVPVYAFVVDGAHAHDLALLLDEAGIAVRSGQHCAHPLLQRYGVAATLRASLCFYNTFDEIRRFGEALRNAVQLLRG